VIYLYLDEFSMRFRGRREKKRAMRALAERSSETPSPLEEHP
jgi:hypothetical protein